MTLSPLAASVRRAIWAARAPRLMTDWIDFATGDDGSAPVCQVLDGEARWIQIATAGQYRGHAAGPFELDQRVFDTLIKNFRAHPSFRAGEQGYGIAGVIAFDWRHASESPPAAGGALAIVVQAAQGWATDLETRTIMVADAGGAMVPKLTLWALACMFEPAKGLVKEKKIKWTSVAIWPDTPHPVTGDNIGWYLSSIALTNDPFIQGMMPIAAGRYVDPWDRACSAGEVVEKLRAIFGLAELADLGTVLTNLATLRAAALGTMAAPAGVDVPELVGALRVLFNLPTLATVETVFAEADKLVAALAQEQAKPKTPPPSPVPVPVAARRTTPQENPMDPQLLALLAAALHCAATQEAITAEMRRLRLDRVTIPTLLEAVAGKGATDAQMAMDKIKAFYTAAGVQDPDAASEAFKAKCAEAKQLMDTFPDLMAVLNEAGEEEDMDAGADVEAVMNDRGYEERGQDGRLILDRDGSDFATILLSRRAGRVEFEKPPVFTADKPGEFIPKALAWIKTTRAGLAARKLARESFAAEYLAVEDQPAGPGQHYLFERIAAPERQGAGGGARALARNLPGGGQGRGGAGPMRGLGRERSPDRLENPAAELPNLKAFSGNLAQRLLGAAEQRMGAEPWKKLTQPERFAKKRELEQEYREAGVDLSEFMPVEERA